MRKPMLVLAIFIIAVAAAAIGPSFLTKNEKKDPSQKPPVNVHEESQPAGSSTSQTPERAAESDEASAVRTDTAGKQELPMIQPDAGEIIVEGTVEAVDAKNRIITFSQELDDNSVQVEPNVEVLKDAIVIKASEGKVSLEAVQKGNYVTMVLNGDRRAKSIEISK